MSEDSRVQWEGLAEKELRGTPLDDLTWSSPEGIEVKPLYTEEDLEHQPRAALQCPLPARFLPQQHRTDKHD